jgi:Rrf2 family protein
VTLSLKSDYAARAVLGLARQHPANVTVRVEQLAEAHKIPPNYLAQILIELKSQGIVRSVRGKDGGYMLARPPAQITMGDVLRAIHGAVFDTPALKDPNCPVELRRAWEKLRLSTEATADAITFQSLVEESDAKDKMYYI